MGDEILLWLYWALNLGAAIGAGLAAFYARLTARDTAELKNGRLEDAVRHILDRVSPAPQPAEAAADDAEEAERPRRRRRRRTDDDLTPVPTPRDKAQLRALMARELP